MPRYKHKKNGTIISVPNVRVLYTSDGTLEVDKDGVYNLSEYDSYEIGGDYENVSMKKNPNDRYR